MKGLFITFEGTEGCGKSTQIRLLAQRLESLKRPVRLLREPGSTSIGEAIRTLIKNPPGQGFMTPETELLLMNAARAQLVREVIRPSLERGEVVLCDRFYDSTTVYQGYGRGLNREAVQQMVLFAVGKTHPDLTLLLRIPQDVSETRRSERNQNQGTACRDRMEEAGREFFKRVEIAYEKLAKTHPKRIRVLDATASMEEVTEKIWEIVGPLLSTQTS